MKVIKEKLKSKNCEILVWRYNTLEIIYNILRRLSIKKIKSKKIKIIFWGVFQLIIYIVTQSYILYFFIGIFSLVLNNTMIIKKFDSKLEGILYSNNKQQQKINQKYNTKKVLRISRKTSEITLEYIDNFFIYVILGHHMSNIYSNYDIIISGIENIVNLIYESIFDLCNNILKKIKISRVEKAYSLIIISGIIYFIIGEILYKYLNGFIRQWIGHKEILGRHIMLILVLNLCFAGVLFSVKKSRRTLGILKRKKENSIIILTFVIIISMIFGELYGIAGILIGGMLGKVMMKFIMEIAGFLRISSIYKGEGRLLIVNNPPFFIENKFK